jgi:hypothetical protein
MKVDNSTDVPYNQKRNSIRITSQDFYDVGSLWILDLTHIPYGCSVRPVSSSNVHSYTNTVAGRFGLRFGRKDQRGLTTAKLT